MKTYYLDQTTIKDCISVFARDAQVIPAGTTVNTMSDRHKNPEYDRYAREYDIHFLFESNRPEPDFYAAPQFDIFATDSNGGYLGTLGGASDTNSDHPICYLDSRRSAYRVADSLVQLIRYPEYWREQMTPTDAPRLFPTREDAMRALEFIEIETIRG